MDEDRMLAMARQEEAKLRSALSQNPDYLKLQQVQRLIAVYERFETKAAEERQAAPHPQHQRAVQPQAGVASRRSEKLAAAEDWTVAFLKEQGVRMQSGDIYPYAESAGFAFGGEMPSRAFASFLSSSSKFNNVRGLGYGLVEWGDGPGPKAVNAVGGTYNFVPPETSFGITFPEEGRSLIPDDISEGETK